METNKSEQDSSHKTQLKIALSAGRWAIGAKFLWRTSLEGLYRLAQPHPSCRQAKGWEKKTWARAGVDLQTILLVARLQASGRRNGSSLTVFSSIARMARWVDYRKLRRSPLHYSWGVVVVVDVVSLLTSGGGAVVVVVVSVWLTFGWGVTVVVVVSVCCVCGSAGVTVVSVV